MTFEAAIREFLESFRLPGEAQKIIRILEHWSRQFYAQEPGIFASADAVYILAISVIMLNTDKHNPAVRPPVLTPLGFPFQVVHWMKRFGHASKVYTQLVDEWDPAVPALCSEEHVLWDSLLDLFSRPPGRFPSEQG